MDKIEAQTILEKLGITGKVEGISGGAINDIIFFSDKQGSKVLRCRTREEIFGYEKGFFKEPLLTALLSMAKPFNPKHNERALKQATRTLLRSTAGTLPFTALPLPQTLFYDHTRRILPCLYMIQECVEGPLLIETASEKDWYNLGCAIGRLHAVQLEKAGPFNDRTHTAQEKIQSIIDGVHQNSPVPVTRVFDVAQLAQGALGLCHGDVHGNNVIVGNATTILDWDNASVDFCELDLVKPLHWCATDKKGFFSSNRAFYSAYIKGHEAAYGRPVDPERMKLYELSWLCRVYQFEAKREASGRIPEPPAPAAAHYLKRIRELATAHSSKTLGKHVGGSSRNNPLPGLK